MATITVVASNPAGHGSNVEKYFWETLTETNADGSPVTPAGLINGTVQVTGTFGSATVVLQGTCDGTNWVTVEDNAGNAISLTAAGAADFSCNYLSLRPFSSGGTGQDVDVTMILRHHVT